MSIPHLFINAGHIAVVAPAVAYLGWKGFKNQPISIGKNFGIALLVLAIVIIAYHAYRIHTKSWAEYKATKTAAPAATAPAPAAAPVK